MARTLKRTTSPVRAVVDLGSMDNPVSVLLATVRFTLALPLPPVAVVALIVARPGEIAVTTPALSTVATSDLLEVQFIVSVTARIPF